MQKPCGLVQDPQLQFASSKASFRRSSLQIKYHTCSSMQNWTELKPFESKLSELFSFEGDLQAVIRTLLRGREKGRKEFEGMSDWHSCHKTHTFPSELNKVSRSFKTLQSKGNTSNEEEGIGKREELRNWKTFLFKTVLLQK